MKRYVLGIDGGGTKTDAVIMDGAGHIVGAGIGGGSNTSFVSMRAAVNAFKRAIGLALAQASLNPEDIDFAGCTFASAAQTAFAELGIRAKLTAYGEGMAALERAEVREDKGVVITAGTGSHVFGINAEGRKLSIGGWGAVLGDDGSAYDIGLRGLRRALATSEGRYPETALLDAARRYFGVDHVSKVVGKLCGSRVRQSLVAGFAVEVGEAAADGDEAALRIVEEAGEQLGEMAAFVARQLFGDEDEFPFVLAGGVFNMGKLIIEPVRAVVRPQFPRARMVVARMRPGEAVARMVLRDNPGRRRGC